MKQSFCRENKSSLKYNHIKKKKTKTKNNKPNNHQCYLNKAIRHT